MTAVKQADPSRFAVDASIEMGKLWVTLADGTTIGTPLYWYPFLEKATDLQRSKFTLYPDSLVWDELDEGLSVDAMFLPPNRAVAQAIAAHSQSKNKSA
jgi:hypothetical protein